MSNKWLAVYGGMMETAPLNVDHIAGCLVERD